MKCEVDGAEFVEAWAEISEIEGYFCNLKFLGTSKKTNYKNIPRKVKVTVSVSGY